MSARTVPLHHRLVAALFVAGAYAGALHAQAADAPAVVPPEFSESARKAYATALREARTLAAQKEYDLALTRLDALAVEHPREPQARFLKASVLTDQGKEAAAIAQLVALAADFPELPEPHNNLAVLYGRQGQYELARRELETAIAAVPDYAVGRENLGDVYVRLAAIQYEKVAQLDKRGKSAPLKLKLVREVLAANESVVVATPTAAPAAPASALPGNAAPTPPATTTPSPLTITTEPTQAAPATPAVATDTKEIVK